MGTIRREYLDWVIPLSEVHPAVNPEGVVEHYNGVDRTAGWVLASQVRRDQQR